MRLLVTSDWHTDRSTLGVPRLGEIQRAVAAAARAAVDESCDAFVFLGDLCDPDSGADVIAGLELAAETISFLSGREVQSAWIAGNHDVLEDGSGRTTLSPLRGLTGPSSSGSHWVCEAPRRFTLHRGPKERLHCLALPYTAATNPLQPDAEAYVRSQTRRVHAVFGHLMLPGIVPGEETTEMSRGRDVDLPVDTIRTLWPGAAIFNGHYHRRQTFRGVEIPGALARLTFGEAGHRPCWLVADVPGERP